MIIEKVGDIFNSSMQTITAPVNTDGVMGKGLALAFKNKYPSLLPAYKLACQNNIFDKEGLFVYRVNRNRQVLCFPTKHSWREPSKLEWVDFGLKLLSLHYKWYEVTSISLPPLGCGLGGLDFKEVKTLIYQYFEHHPLLVELIVPRAY